MKSNERKFVDLIFRNNRGKYANLDPAGPVAVGDYGYVAKSGRFMKEGNIFKDNLVTPSQLAVPPAAGRVNLRTLTAEGTRSLHIDGTVGADLAGFAECTFKARYGFSEGSGAALVMLNAVMTRIDNQGYLRKLFQDGRLQPSQAIVTEVHACPSYTLFLSGNGSGEALFGLGARTPPISGVSATAALEMGWVGRISSGELQSAHANDGIDRYYPLFELCGVRPKRGSAVNDLRDSPLPPPEEGEPERLRAYPTPWGLLDDEGDETVFVDNVPDSDSDDEV